MISHTEMRCVKILENNLTNVCIDDDTEPHAMLGIGA